MRTHILTALCVGVILAIGPLGAQSNSGHFKQNAAVETVDRTHKSDRLPLARTRAARERTGGLELPEGCDALVSPLAHRQLARTAAHCDS